MESLTDILTNFATASNTGIWTLMPYASKLVMTLAIIDTVYSHLIQMEDGNHIHILTWNVFKYGFCYFFISYYHWIIISLLDGFIQFGFIASGNKISVATLTDPTYILQLGAAVADPLNQQLKFINDLGGGFGQQMNLVIITMGVQLSYVIIAIQVFIAYLEFYIIGALGVVLLPFWANRHTSFLGNKVMPFMVGIALKIAVLSFILSLVLPYIQNHLPPAVDDTTPIISTASSMDILACSLAFAFLVWRVPNMAAKLTRG
jgi:type IV secretion system protein TrbL